MATTTATILIGRAHQNNSGINPTHMIFFTENDRPAIIVKSLDWKSEDKVVIPTIENTVDDIYLTIAVYILNGLNPSIELLNSNGDSLYDILDQEQRIKLYNETLMFFEKNRFKVVFNILHDSHLLTQLDAIKKYPNDFEVTLPVMKKEYNAWSQKVLKNGI
jgi:hypothetical protein